MQFRKKTVTTTTMVVAPAALPLKSRIIRKHRAYSRPDPEVLIQRPPSKAQPADLPTTPEKKGPKIPLTPQKRDQDLSKKVCDWLTRILFMGNSRCLACAFFNDQFWIGANELTESSNSTSKTPEIMILIQKVMEYFAHIAWQKEIIPEHRYALLLKISQKLADADSAKGSMIVPPELIEDILKKVIAKQSLDQEHYLQNYGQYAPDLSRIATEIRIMYDEFEATEHWTKKTAQKDPDNKMLNALKRRARGYKILLTSSKPIHAEMHILEKILELLADNQINKNELIYIGVSIFSCPYCQKMLQTAVEVLEAQDLHLQLKIQGGHGLCPKTWRLPTSFTEGYKQAMVDHQQQQTQEPDASEHSINFLIGYRFFSKVQKIHERYLKIPRKISPHAPLSDTESGGFDAEGKLKEYQEKIEQRIASLKTLPFPEETEKNIKLFLALKTSQHLLGLLQALDDHETQRAENYFLSICNELKAKEIEITPNALLALFGRDHTFSGVLRNFAQHFDLKTQPEKKSASSSNTFFVGWSTTQHLSPSGSTTPVATDFDGVIKTESEEGDLFSQEVAVEPDISSSQQEETAASLPIKRPAYAPIIDTRSSPKHRKITGSSSSTEHRMQQSSLFQFYSPTSR